MRLPARSFQSRYWIYKMLRRVQQRLTCKPGVGSRLFATRVAPLRHGTACNRTTATCTAAGAAATAAGLLVIYQGGPCVTAAPGMTHNVPLAARHRVVLTQWPALEDPENGITTIESVFEWASRNGYDALEFSVDDFKKKFFPRASTAEVIRRVQACVKRYNLPTIGALYHVPGRSNFAVVRVQSQRASAIDTLRVWWFGAATSDLACVHDYFCAADGVTPAMGKRVHDDGTRFDLCLADDADFFQALREKLLLERQIGLEYINFHLRLPPRYLNSGGECVQLCKASLSVTHNRDISRCESAGTAMTQRITGWWLDGLSVSRHYVLSSVSIATSKHI